MIQVPRRRLSRQVENSSSGARLDSVSLSFIPADAVIRPLRDRLIVEPLDVVYSRYLWVDIKSKPLRATVRAAGPGTYEIGYMDAYGNKTTDRRKRTQMYHSKTWIPMQVKEGDIVQLGGAEHGGYSFEQFWWGDRIHLHCREADVCGIEDAQTHH